MHSGGSVVASDEDRLSAAIDVSGFGERHLSGMHPNQSLEPTPKAVMHPACAGCTPALGVAHH